MRENDYTLRARALLRSMGMPPNCKGYRYLTWAVALTAQTLDREGRLPGGLYRRVGVCCAAKPETVERSCRCAVARLWKEGNGAVRSRWFPKSTAVGKNGPPIAVFVRILAQVLLREWQDLG
ncbi:MAG: hypothetical protein IJ049_06710 [Oscillospiraceae bacterium]|nr:hypothetical protein [Oscillospiraceae bacterium]MBR1845590.1 hypothetical protein [Oscillospiraceae bacterium]